MTRNHRRNRGLWLICLASVTIALPAQAQEAIHTDAALAPGKGRLLWRQQVRYSDATSDPTGAGRDVETLRLSTTLAYGVTGEVTAIANIPYDFRRTRFPEGPTRKDDGLADPTVLAKWRLHRRDSGPVASERFSVLGGLEIRSGDTGFTSDSYNPIIGGVYTRYQDRHGFNADLIYTFNTGGGAHDTVRYDAGYTYRLFPARFEATDTAALFGVVELNGRYDLNGEHELFISPGVQYGRGRWAIEASVQLPAWQDLKTRPERDFVAVLGLKLLF